MEEVKRRFYVYIYYDPRPGKDEVPVYVGKGQGGRKDEHRRKNSQNLMLRRLVNKCKELGLKPVIEVLDDMEDETEAFAYERALILTFGRRDLGTGTLYNMTDGGEGVTGRIVSKSERSRLREANLGKSHTEEARAKMSASHRGVTPNWSEDGKKRIVEGLRRPETSEKIRLANLGQKRSGVALANMQAAPHLGMTGKRHSDETKEICRKVNLGKKLSDETKQLIREAHTGTKASDETRAKLSIAQKGQAFHQDPAHRAKLSAALTGRIMTASHKAALKEAWVRRRARGQEAA